MRIKKRSLFPSIPIICTYLRAIGQDTVFAAVQEHRRVFTDLLSVLDQHDFIDLLNQVSVDDIATFILNFSTKEDILLLVDWIRQLLNIAKGSEAVLAAALDKVFETSLTETQKPFIYFLLDYFELANLENRRKLSADDNPRQQQWIAESAGEIECLYSSRKLQEIASKEANTNWEISPEEKLEDLAVTATMLQRGVNLGPVTLNGEIISAHTIMISQLGSILQGKMSDETRESGALSLREVAQQLHALGTPAKRKDFLTFIVQQIVLLTDRAEPQIVVRCEPLYTVISAPKLVDESLDDYIHRILIGFVINDACVYLPNERGLQKFIAWRLTQLKPDHQESYGYLTTFGEFGDPDFMAFKKDPEKYFQSQANKHEYLEFLGRLSDCYQSLRLTLSPSSMISLTSEYFALLASGVEASTPTFIQAAIQNNDPAHLLPLLTQLDQASLDLFIARFAENSKVQIIALFLQFSSELLLKLCKALIRNKLDLIYFKSFVDTHLAPYLNKGSAPLSEAKVKKLAEYFQIFYRQALEGNAVTYLTVLRDCILRALTQQDKSFNIKVYQCVIHPMIEMTLTRSKPTEEMDRILVDLLKNIVSSKPIINGPVIHVSSEPPFKKKERTDLFVMLLNPILTYGLSPKHWVEVLTATFDMRNSKCAKALLEQISHRPELRAIADPKLWPEDAMVSAHSKGADASVLRLMVDCGFAPQELIELINVVLDENADSEIIRLLFKVQLEIDAAKDQQIAALTQEVQALRQQVRAEPPARRLSMPGIER